MKIHVVSRSMAQYMTHTLDCETAIISITDIGSRLAKFNNNQHIFSVCRLQFADTLSGMSAHDAEVLVSFIENSWGQIEQFLIHCEAGISRSAGVAAAICIAHDLDDDFIWESKRFLPNPHVITQMLNAYGRDADIKEFINRKNLLLKKGGIW
jgi:predicted protein tyrosine phosphatase